jgi:hypothetical protein
LHEIVCTLHETFHCILYPTHLADFISIMSMYRSHTSVWSHGDTCRMLSVNMRHILLWETIFTHVACYVWILGTHFCVKTWSHMWHAVCEYLVHTSAWSHGHTCSMLCVKTRHIRLCEAMVTHVACYSWRLGTYFMWSHGHTCSILCVKTRHILLCEAMVTHVACYVLRLCTYFCVKPWYVLKTFIFLPNEGKMGIFAKKTC